MAETHRCSRCTKIMKTPNRWMLCLQCRGKQCPGCQKWHDRSKATHCRMCENPDLARERLIAESRKRHDIRRKRELARLKAQAQLTQGGDDYE